MDIHDLHPPDDYSHRFFIWHEWIQANGLLTSDNVFDYFATSMFYDKQSNNQVLRMQTMHTGIPLVNEAEELKRFTGVEFAVVQAMPPKMFVIHKRERLSPDEVRPLAAYFIMNNRIYQSPDVYTVLSNRLLTSLYSLQSSLDTLRAHRPDFTSRTGFVWPIVDHSSVADEASKRRDTSEEPHTADASLQQRQQSLEAAGKQKLAGSTASMTGTAAGPPRRQQNDTLLLKAMWTTATHSKMAFTSGALPLPEGGGTSALDAVAATPAAGQAVRSSATPGPSKPPAGVVKKKRKRTSLAPPATEAPASVT